MKRLFILFLLLSGFVYGQRMSEYAAETSPAGTDNVVGYRTAGVAGGNRRFTLSTLNTYFSANLSLDWARITSGRPTTLSGYGIADALAASTAASTYAPINNPTFTGTASFPALTVTTTLTLPAASVPDAAIASTIARDSEVTSAVAGVTPTSLGLVIGTNTQAYDADLTTWAGITPGSNVGTFIATPSSANFAAALTDETGTGSAVFGTNPALQSPTYTVNAVSALDIDWNAGDHHTKTLSANTTFTFSNLPASGKSKIITVRVQNTASNYTVTWPTVVWAGGSAPTQTVGAKSDIYTFLAEGSTVYGSVNQNF